MSFESFGNTKSKNEVRADEVMERLRDKKSPSVPAAIRQVLRNEMITNESDVKRIQSEIGALLAERKISHEEEVDYEKSLKEREALEMIRQRGGDPED